MNQLLADKLVNAGKMFPRTIEGVLFDTGSIRNVLYVPVPLNPGVMAPTSIDDCMIDYWLPRVHQNSRSHRLDLYRKTIQVKIENTITEYTVHFTDQTAAFPINTAVQGMGRNSVYRKWTGPVLVIKSDHNGCPLPCKGKDSLYIPDAIERFFTVVKTESPYKRVSQRTVAK